MLSSFSFRVPNVACFELETQEHFMEVVWLKLPAKLIEGVFRDFVIATTLPEQSPRLERLEKRLLSCLCLLSWECCRAFRPPIYRELRLESKADIEFLHSTMINGFIQPCACVVSRISPFPQGLKQGYEIILKNSIISTTPLGYSSVTFISSGTFQSLRNPNS